MIIIFLCMLAISFILLVGAVGLAFRREIIFAIILILLCLSLGAFSSWGLQKEINEYESKKTEQIENQN